jgi:hypothetical protein
MTAALEGAAHAATNALNANARTRRETHIIELQFNE